MSDSTRDTDACDVIVADHFSIVLVKPQTDAAREWMQENLPDETMYWAGGAVVEPRYVDSILDGMMADGLVVV